MIICICIHRVRTAQILWKIRSNSWENITTSNYYLLTCCIVVNVVVWEIGREKQAAGQSRAPGRVIWTKCLPRDTIQPMEYTRRNSNEIICKHRKLPLQVPGKVFGESVQSVSGCDFLQDVNVTTVFSKSRRSRIARIHARSGTRRAPMETWFWRPCMYTVQACTSTRDVMTYDVWSQCHFDFWYFVLMLLRH